MPVKQEVVDNEALVTSKRLERYKNFETLLRLNKNDTANMAYPFAIMLPNK